MTPGPLGAHVPLSLSLARRSQVEKIHARMQPGNMIPPAGPPEQPTTISSVKARTQRTQQACSGRRTVMAGSRGGPAVRAVELLLQPAVNARWLCAGMHQQFVEFLTLRLSCCRKPCRPASMFGCPFSCYLFIRQIPGTVLRDSPPGSAAVRPADGEEGGGVHGAAGGGSGVDPRVSRSSELFKRGHFVLDQP